MKRTSRTITAITGTAFILLSAALGIAANLISSLNTGLIYVILIIFTIAGLGIAVSQMLADWLRRRRDVSITIKTNEGEIVARNLTGKDAERLAEIFLSLQAGEFSIFSEKDGKEKITSEKQNSSDAMADTPHEGK